jgi:ABC-type glutathione transport system ATPase component/ABC-type multidrug transport system permease subunit
MDSNTHVEMQKVNQHNSPSNTLRNNQQNLYVKSEENDLIIQKNNNHTNEMELTWRDITITAPIISKSKDKKETEETIILDKVSGKVKTGECLAIIGSSGAGKTTLLNYLSRKIESRTLKITGDVLLNGEAIENEKFNLISSYVMQDDILEATMTPLEILLFTAKLKLNLTHEQIEEKVEKMIEDLHLKKCQNTKIGSVVERGVSGGERKRTSIGVELISDPKIIFLDEPTTGLDSYNAYEVIQLLRVLAQKGKIIVFTIHQPSSEIFDLLDKLNILALGKTVYYGPSHKSLDCFEAFNLKMPLNYNPFEHFMEMTNVSIIQNSEILKKYPELESIENFGHRHSTFISTLNQKYESLKTNYLTTTQEIKGLSSENAQLFRDKNYSKSFLYEFSMLFGRNILIVKRNPKVLAMKIVQSIITAVLLAILFTNVTKDFTGIQDRLGIVLNCIVHVIFGAITTTILVFSEEKKVFMRERANSLYSVFAYFIAKFFSELPVNFVSNNLFGLIIYYSTELNDTYSFKFFAFLGILNFCAMGGNAWAFFLGSLASNPEALININTALTIPLLLLSGFFANANNFAPYLIPFKYLSMFKYGFQTLIHNEFQMLSPLNCQNLAPDMCTPMATRFTFLEPFYLDFVLITALIIFFKTISFILLYKFAKIKV